jgi:hypothetical protein
MLVGVHCLLFATTRCANVRHAAPGRGRPTGTCPPLCPSGRLPAGRKSSAVQNGQSRRVMNRADFCRPLVVSPFFAANDDDNGLATIKRSPAYDLDLAAAAATDGGTSPLEVAFCAW